MVDVQTKLNLCINQFRSISELDKINIIELGTSVQELFRSLGLSEEDTQFASDVILYPQLCGLDSHGLCTMPLYVTGLLDKTIKSLPNVTIKNQKVCTLLIDADNGLGLSESKKAMLSVMNLAKTYGLGAAAVRNSSHFGSAGYYADLAARQGLIGLAFSNAAPAIAPTGGLTQLLGTNPIGAGVPIGNREPMVLDMATSVVARSRIRQILSSGQSCIPEGWALDSDGKPTTNAELAISGSVLPIGGAKGYGLSLLIEFLCSALADTEAGFSITYENVVKRPSGISHFFLAIDPNGFAGLEKFIQRSDYIASTIEESKCIKGEELPRIPGSRGHAKKIERLDTGIPIGPSLKLALIKTADIIEKHISEFS